MGKKCNYAENYPCLDLRMIHKILSDDFLKLIRAQSEPLYDCFSLPLCYTFPMILCLILHSFYHHSVA